ncbi:MAG: ABC transporter substrate-binding protein [Campylobacterales bacterium]|nr:ABC transporter substrate-binding protein [Campylobacterales bacterium]
MKKISLLLFVISLSFLQSEEKLERLVLSGPFASVSHPLVHMVESGALKDVAKEVEFRLWKNPDELRVITIQKGADFVAVPTNVGANLHNKGVEIELLNVSVWGILGMVTRDPNLKTLADFKGKEIAMPFRSDMPDILFGEVAKQQGLNPKKDFKLRYVSSPVDAMQMLIMRRVDHALLAEPAISIALRKTKSFPMKIVAPDIYRSVNLQKEWGKVFKTEAKVPQAGIAFLGGTKGKEHLIERFNQEYKKSLAWYKANPKKAGELVVKYMPMLQAEGVADSIPNVNLNVVSAKEAKKDLEFFFEILKKSNPKLLGGNLPDDSYYR